MVRQASISIFAVLIGCTTPQEDKQEWLNRTVPKADQPAATSPTCSSSSEQFDCVQFLQNYDGDTITVTITEIHPLFGERIPVRIRGIDTAEIRGNGPCEKGCGLDPPIHAEPSS